MDFYQKMNKAEKLLKLNKAFKFINPKYGMYGVGVSLLFLLFDKNDIATVISLTVLGVAMIDMLFMVIASFLFNKAFGILNECVTYISDAKDTDEALAYMKRHLEVLEKA